jgi:hypothetical protein
MGGWGGGGGEEPVLLLERLHRQNSRCTGGHFFLPVSQMSFLGEKASYLGPNFVRRNMPRYILQADAIDKCISTSETELSNF